jgi:hypothetical protein
VLDDDKHVVLVVEGKFDRRKFLALLTKNWSLTKKASDQAGGDYFTSGKRGGPMLAFRGRYTIVSGNESSLLAALARRRSTLDRRSVRWRARRAAQDSDAFVVATANDAMRRKLGREDRNLGQLRTLDTRLKLGAGLALTTDAQFSSARAAADLHALLRRGLREASESRKLRSLGLGRFVEKITLRHAADKLGLDIKLSRGELADLIDRLEALAAKQKRRP